MTVRESRIHRDEIPCNVTVIAKLSGSQKASKCICKDRIIETWQGDVFTNLVEIISYEENIRLAYRNIKAYLDKIKPNKSQLDKINKLRVLAGNTAI